jgi:hypothetical protein
MELFPHSHIIDKFFEKTLQERSGERSLARCPSFLSLMASFSSRAVYESDAVLSIKIQEAGRVRHRNSYGIFHAV